SILAVCQSIRDITAEAGTQTGAALSGNLSLRADLSRFQGGYRSIVEGFNQTIDALVHPIQEASAVIQQIAVGNLTVRMEGSYKGDHAVIKDSLNAALDTFNRLLGDIRQASEEVATGSQQLSGSSQSLSQGATEQASSIEQISASIEELAVQTRQNAGSAGTASELSAQARTSALHGNERMRSMLESMNSINESSANISKIIKVIDDIAFQTNILALNAAVEAARAGQYGRGFAVVAEEVRSLAARSAEAAKETTLMIENSIKRVNDGTAIANITAEALEEIVDKVGQATDLVMSISESSNEQAGGIVQINEALSQVSKVVQLNSAAAEQSASSSEELTGQAGMLREMAQRFKLRS
ncbi:MAG: methyl-accepting chemotaxis protein, partial [Clostridia bacterium]|nr:methyl-accepting chemotaxis protein [Clostridia bacterium]